MYAYRRTASHHIREDGHLGRYIGSVVHIVTQDDTKYGLIDDIAKLAQGVDINDLVLYA